MVEETLTLDEESSDSSTDRQSLIVELGDTEVVVRQTDSGFEVEEAEEEPEDEPTGAYIRIRCRGYGCEIPLDGDYIYRPHPERPDDSYVVAYHQEDDISEDLNSTGFSGFMSRSERDRYDGYASVNPEYTEINHY